VVLSFMVGPGKAGKWRAGREVRKEIAQNGVEGEATAAGAVERAPGTSGRAEERNFNGASERKIPEGRSPAKRPMEAPVL